MFFDSIFEEYDEKSYEFDRLLNCNSICESLLLPVEEGFVNKVKSMFTAIYKKFHEIFMKFKAWVKSIINRIKGFFKKDSKKDTKKDSPSINPETAKEDVKKVENTLKIAEKVDKEFRDTLNSTEKNPDQNDEKLSSVKEKADSAVAEMKSVQASINSTYSPDKSENQKEEKNMNSSISDSQDEKEKMNNFVKTNPFKYPKFSFGAIKTTYRIVSTVDDLKNHSVYTRPPVLKELFGTISEKVHEGNFETAREMHNYIFSNIGDIVNNYFKKLGRVDSTNYEWAKEDVEDKEIMNSKSPEEFYETYSTLYVLHPSNQTLNDLINIRKEQN